MNSIIVLICFLAAVNCQAIIQNYTVVNTTVIRNYGYGPVQQPVYGFRPNVTRYDPYGGYINQTVGRRNGNDLIVGNPGPYDIILFKQWFVKGSRLFQSREKIITYPTNPWSNHNIITAIGVFDLAQRPGGHASILSGGVGHRNVTIRLFSDRGNGFNYKVVIHGR